jgi:hypothetical protein
MALFQIGSTDNSKRLSCFRNILEAIHDHIIRMWLSQNQVLHSKDDEDLANIRSAETAEITRMHGQPDLLCLADRHLCSRPLQKLLLSSPAI